MLWDHCGIIYREMPGIQGLPTTFGVSFLPLAHFPQRSAFQKHLERASAHLPFHTTSLVFSCLTFGFSRTQILWLCFTHSESPGEWSQCLGESEGGGEEEQLNSAAVASRDPATESFVVGTVLQRCKVEGACTPHRLVIEWRLLLALPNQTWVHLPASSKGNLLTPGCGEGRRSVYCRAPSKESRQLVLKRPELPEGFQGKVFKDRVKERGCGVCVISSWTWTFFWLVRGEVIEHQHHQPSGSSQSGVCMLVVSIQLTSSTWFLYLQNSSKDVAQKII